MFNRVIILIITIFFSVSAIASNNCFITKENNKIIKQVGKCELRHSPYSSFKIVLALIGFDSEILTDSEHHLVEFTDERKVFLGDDLYDPNKYPVMNFWNQPHNPSTFMKYSVVWYSQYITQNLGYNKFKYYLDKLNYGNKNISGIKKGDSLRRSWINNTLQISPIEQLNFIERLMNNNLPLSSKAQENTKKIIKLDNVWNDWNLYGKTGGGKSPGWFVGWIQKDNRKIAFAQYIEQSPDSLLSGGKVAKEVALNNLIPIVLKIKN